MTFGPTRQALLFVAGSALLVVGLDGLVVEFTPGGCANAVLGIVMVIWGVLLCLVASVPYAPGLRYYVGTLAFSVSAVTAAHVVDIGLMAEFARTDLALAVLFFLFGGHCYWAGTHLHRRRHRKHLAD